MKGELKRAREAFWHLRHGGTKEVRLWKARQNAAQGIFTNDNAQGAEGLWEGRGRRKQLRFRPAERPPIHPRRSIRVGAILDEFSWLAFEPEWEMTWLTPANWEPLLRTAPFDLLFVESAWNGNGGTWKYHLTGTRGPSTALRTLVTACQAAGIPTVFWNKEDPPHFEDFLETAKLFDSVFTSDSDTIPRYREHLGHSRIQPLAFAAQPAIHNPVRPRRGWHSRGVAFAGMYFTHKFPERREQLDFLLTAAAQEEPEDRRLEIFSRMLDGSEEYQFPASFARYVVGSLTYQQMLTAYKAYKVFLNVNSVTSSPSMCARRVFEVSAAGTPVVSSPSRAIEAFFPREEVPVVKDRQEAGAVIASLLSHPQLGDRQVHLAQRRIWREHTYSHRVEQILAEVLPERHAGVTSPRVSALVSTIRPHQLEHVFRTVSSQQSIDVELVLLTHGFEISDTELSDLLSEYPIGNVTVLTAPASVSLGDCLNRCVQAASGDVLTKMDDDDYYAANYVVDQLNAMMYSGADVVGKQAHYMYLRSLDFTVLRFAHKEHRYTSQVMGPTIMAKREVFEAFPFASRSTGEDSEFLQRVVTAGLVVYSSDRFNYCQNRNENGHTWKMSAHQLAGTGDFAQFGSPEQYVSI